jgi:hypothetical protein
MPSDPVTRVALIQLEQGDVVLGRQTAKRLQKTQPQLATLYRLEWLASRDPSTGWTACSPVL